MSRGPTEGSVQFSLQELVRLEDERIREQDRDRERKAEAEHMAKARAAAEARAAEEARVRDEEERRRQDALRQQEESTRLAAIEQAALEHARWSAQMKAQSDEAERLRAHTLDLERIKQGGARGAGWRGGFLGAAVAMTLTAATAAILYNASIAPQAEKREEILKAQVSEREAAVAKLASSVGEQSQRIDDLRNRLGQAREENQKLLKELERLKPPPAPAHAAGRGGPVAAPPPPPKCPQWDPLCPQINGK
jgi:hypothetical protein